MMSLAEAKEITIESLLSDDALIRFRPARLTLPPVTGQKTFLPDTKKGQQDDETRQDAEGRLNGIITRIFFSNPETSFATGKFRLRNQSLEVTFAGTVSGHAIGEEFTLYGQWTVHPKYGRQFRVDFANPADPTTVEGIENYLASSDFSGIGPKYAKRIVETFGLQTLEIIEKTPERLLEVPGIGRTRADTIARSWAEAHQVRALMIFLQGYGISSTYAWKIYDHYGEKAVDAVRKDPYRLAYDIRGIGFKISDRIARSMGFAADAPERIRAAIVYALTQATMDGHVFLPDMSFVPFIMELLADGQGPFDLPEEKINDAVDSLLMEGRIVRECIGSTDATCATYLKYFHQCEVSVSRKLRELAVYPEDHTPEDIFSSMSRVQKSMGIELDSEQQKAVMTAATSKVSVITGGPGTGKTTIIKVILSIFRNEGKQILLAAPTGRAAKRMSETTSYPARTIHRLLEFSFGHFSRDEKNPLLADLIIIDEMSMVDISLMNHLLKAISPSTRLIMVGDRNQLPSVGAGNVLKDIIESDVVPVVKLERIFRQAAHSDIVVNAHRIISGAMPGFGRTDSDFLMYEKDDPNEILDSILHIVSRQIPQQFGFDPRADVQVIAPMKKGEIGTHALNTSLQDLLNPERPEVRELTVGLRKYREGDKVMQIRNNYKKDIFNGEIGFITKIDHEVKEVSVDFDGRTVVYSRHDLDDLVLSYAISVHKSQGSEYPVIVMPVTTSHYIMLQRNLLYTAVTRARYLVILVGTKRALSLAIRNNTISTRNTLLCKRLQVS